MDAIELLKRDHEKVESLFARFEKAGDGAGETKRRLVEDIIRELSVHASIEEQYLYPLARERADELQKLTLEALEEHHVAKWLLNELGKLPQKSDRFDAKVKVLIENVRHHVKEEEEELFPLMRELMAAEELDALGSTLQVAKKMAPTRPHPRSPDTPPGVFVAGMMAKVVDTGLDTVRTLRRKGVSAAAKRVRRK